MNIKVTVIVPIFNVEVYLCKCLDSLKAQTLHDIEIILVDDGSTDRSGKICDKYASIDSKFKVIHKKNGGSASARQAGLNIAQGEYVIICDSDDWVEPTIYEKLYYKAVEHNADMAVCGYFSEYYNGRSIPRQNIFNEKDGIVDNSDFLFKGAHTSWVKLIKRSLFDKTNATYEEGINLSEDALIIFKLMKGNPKIVQIKAHLYHYRRLFGKNSYTNNLRMNSIKQLEFTYRWFLNHYRDIENVRYNQAINLAFACLRASDLDKSFLTTFLKNELPWSKINLKQQPLKTLMIIAEKLLPITISKFIFKLAYPLFYK